MRLPTLITERLTIRDFKLEDLETIHQILNVSFDSDLALEERRAWLQWTIASYAQLANLLQPPYGDRAITLTASGTLIGSIGFVPSLMPFELLPSSGGGDPQNWRASPEVGLFWALDPAQRGNGYATEAAQALIDHAFGTLQLRRLVATTEHDNVASQAVMQRLGMAVERNPHAEPVWLQVVGVLENK